MRFDPETLLHSPEKRNKPVSCEAIALAFFGSGPARRLKSEYLWHCPHHDDAHASLKINVRKNNFGCFPCSAAGNYWKLCAFLLGVDPKSAEGRAAIKTFLREHTMIDARPLLVRTGKRTRVAVFEYGPNLRKVRLEPGCANEKKDFVWEHFDGKKWKPGRGGMLPPLYTNEAFRNPDLISCAVGFEGEAKVEIAGTFRVPAFSFKDLRSKQCGPLADLDVVLWPDHDESGTAQASAAAQFILASKTARSVRIVQDFSDLPPKGDLVDGVRLLGWNAAEIEKRIATAAPFSSEPAGAITPERPAPNTRPERRRQSGAKSVRCVREWRETKPEDFALENDGRQYAHLRERRRYLALTLATYANPDGSSITVAVETIMNQTGWSRRTMARLLADLERLGLLKSKKRGVKMTCLRFLKLPQSDVPSSQSDAQSSDENEAE